MTLFSPGNGLGNEPHAGDQQIVIGRQRDKTEKLSVDETVDRCISQSWVADNQQCRAMSLRTLFCGHAPGGMRHCLPQHGDNAGGIRVSGTDMVEVPGEKEVYGSYGVGQRHGFGLAWK